MVGIFSGDVFLADYNTKLSYIRVSFYRSIQEMVTFLDPGFHETKQEEFDGDIKDRPMSLKDIKKLV